MKKVLALILSLLMIFSFSAVSFAADENELPFDNSDFYICGDYSLHYRTFMPKEEAKNQIMLLHGFGLSTASFEPLAQKYAANGYKVVLLDLPNFGYSSRETVDMKLLSREELVYSLMSFLGGKWILGGHSMGGGVAINVATAHSDAVSALVLFAPQTNSAPNPIMASFMKSAPVRAAFELVIRLASRSESIIEKMVAMSFSDDAFAKEYDCEKISAPLKRNGTGSGMAIMSSHTTSTDFAAFSMLNIPTVIVTAKNDKVASKDNLDKIISNAPLNTEFYTFENGGHMMMEYNSDLAFEATAKTLENALYA